MGIVPLHCWRLCKRHLHASCRHLANVVGKPLHKICVVGSGPAGFYTAEFLMKNPNVQVDIYEKLPVPFGLIRFGVAPDHPEIKNVVKSFNKIASKERFNFYGNVAVGKDVTVTELLKSYNAVVLSYGAEANHSLGIPGEDLKNVLSAHKFVGWYNGHPDNADLNIDLDTDVATVIGHGNVALDVTRMLLRNPDELKVTDIPEHVFERLKKSRIKKVIQIGRRGPLQVAFTVKELREMINLSGCHPIMHLSDFEGMAEIVPSLPRPRVRITGLMVETASEQQDRDVAQKWKEASREWELKFCRTPLAILPNESNQVKEMVLQINKLDGLHVAAKIISAGQEEVISCGLVLKSIGYRSTLIDSCIPFDKKNGIIPNDNGRILGKSGLYCSGWVKTGPVGVVLSTMNGSSDTGVQLLRDLESGEISTHPCSGSEEILSLLKSRGIGVVTFDQWEKIDAIEKERGEKLGKLREKILSTKEMLQIAGVM